MRDSKTPCSYHGRSLNSRVVNGLSLMEAVYDSNLELPKHSHRHAGFCLILQGAYTESYGKTTLNCRPSYVKFQPAEEVHADVYGNELVHSFIIELESGWLTRMRAYDLVMNRPAVFRDSTVVWLMMKLRKEYLSRDEAARLAIEGLMLELIAETSRSRPKDLTHNRPRWLDQTKEFLHERFSEPLTLSHIAEAVGVHPVYLANSFRRHYNCSVGEYLRRRRIEAACYKLSNTKTPLVDIALATGFSHQSHFSRVFKQMTGLTPTQYRKTSGTS